MLWWWPSLRQVSGTLLMRYYCHSNPVVGKVVAGAGICACVWLRNQRGGTTICKIMTECISVRIPARQNFRVVPLGLVQPLAQWRWSLVGITHWGGVARLFPVGQRHTGEGCVYVWMVNYAWAYWCQRKLVEVCGVLFKSRSDLSREEKDWAMQLVPSKFSAR